MKTKKIGTVDCIFTILIVGLLGGFLLGAIANFVSLKWIENLGRGLVIVGLIAVPTLFANIAYGYWQKDKKLAIQTYIFAAFLLAFVLPVIIMLCS